MRSIVIKMFWGLCFVLSMFASVAIAGEANLFNPYMHDRLPAQSLNNDGANMAKSLGGKNSNLQDEASHRQYFRQEVYPIVFGNAKSINELIVFIDYANKQSANLWSQVITASKTLNPQNCKIVVFAKNSEAYGTELMGGGIWIAYARAAYALDYFNYSLHRWNEVKQTLQARGVNRPFVYEYDATANKKEYPILYSYLTHVKPEIPQNDYMNITKYAFDAGNINMFQAVMAAKEYDVETFPAIVVNGKLLNEPSAQNIIAALQ